MNARNIVLVIPILAILPTGCDRQPPTAAVEPTNPSANTVTSLPRIDLDGLRTIINESAEANQVLVIDFWATWCAPCVAMFPELHGRLEANGQGVRLISASFDAPEDEGKAIAFLQEHHALHDAYLLVPDTDRQIEVVRALGNQWRDLVVPAILVFDTDGTLAGEFLQGGVVEAIVAKVDELLSPGVNREAAVTDG